VTRRPSYVASNSWPKQRTFCVFSGKISSFPRDKDNPDLFASSGHVDNGSQENPGFDGMIKWQPGSKAVKLMWENLQGTREQSIMEFGKGDEATHKDCIVEILAFMQQGSRGIDRARQFRYDEEWHWELWANAIAVCGWPKIK